MTEAQESVASPEVAAEDPETTEEPVAEPVPEAAGEVAAEPASEVGPEPAVEAAVEPEPEAKAAPEPEPEPEPVAEAAPDPEPVAEAAPEPEPKPAPKPKRRKKKPESFEEGDFVFYPQIGHCDVGGVTSDEATGLELLELTPQDSASGNRILVPLAQVGQRGIRRAGDSPGVIEEVLGSDFEPTIDDASERLDLITAQEKEGTVESLAHALKRLHLRHEMKTISREEEKRRARIRKWLVMEYLTEKEGTPGQAQSAITRLLSRTMNAVREREKEAARALRKQERAERKAAAEERRARRRGRG